MRLPITLSLYVSRHFMLAFGVAMLTVLSVVGLIEMIELIRRASHKEYEVPFSVVLEMTIMKIPATAEQILPFGILIGAMVALTRLTKSSELIVARASGVSVWQFMMPVLLCAAGLGLFFTAVFNPLSAAMITRFESLEGKYITNKPSILSVSPSGLWLRQVETLDSHFQEQPIEEYILHARRISQSDMTMANVIIFIFGKEHQFIGRIDAPAAILEQGFWRVRSAMLSAPGTVPKQVPEFHLKTELSMNQIKESFSSPKTLSFWELPSFITTLEKAGFSALRHRLYFQTLLATPLMLCAMVLIGAIFSLRHHRRGKIGVLIAVGIISGFVVYFVSNLVYALGFSGGLPVGLAAWTPPLVALMIGTACLLHYEDG